MSALSVGDRQGRSGRRADRRHALDFDLAKISFVGCHVLEWTKVLDLRSKITQPLCRFGMHLGTNSIFEVLGCFILTHDQEHTRTIENLIEAEKFQKLAFSIEEPLN